jgi:hypothetical protein
VLTLYAFYRKNGLITSSQSFSLNLIDGSLRTCERCIQLKKKKGIILPKKRL